MTKIFLSHCYASLLLAFLCLPVSLSATLSEIERNQLVDNGEESYIYCGKDHSRMAEVIERISKFDENKNSPVCQLHDHIERGFSIGRRDAIVEALTWAEEIINKNYEKLNDGTFEEIQATLRTVMNAVANDQ